MPKPFIKWVGGKRQLLPELLKRIPEGIDDYFEPFIGGGALLFNIKKEDFKTININDYNEELVNLYLSVRDDVELLIDSLHKHQNNKEYFLTIRDLDRNPNYEILNSVEKASRFIFLNKTCFNGLYRVNKKGFFNSPFGYYENPNVCDSENLKECSIFLNGINITHGDFENIKPKLNHKSFVYFDPPYMPVSETSNFLGYNANQFDLNSQIRLKEFCDYINSIGAKFMLSNSNSEIILELYKDYKIEIVNASRSINSNGAKRGKIKEVIITNYWLFDATLI